MPRTGLLFILLSTSSASPEAPVDLAALAHEHPNKIEVTSTAKEHGIAGIRGAKATFVVEGGRDQVLNTLWDVDAFPEMFPDIDDMKVLSRSDDRIKVHFAIDAIVTKAEYTLDRKLDREHGTISWTEVGEGDVKHIRGSWSVKPTTDARFTEVIYASYVDVGYYVPSGAVRDVAIKKIDELAGRVRTAIRKRAPKSKPPSPKAAPATSGSNP